MELWGQFKFGVTDLSRIYIEVNLRYIFHARGWMDFELKGDIEQAIKIEDFCIYFQYEMGKQVLSKEKKRLFFSFLIISSQQGGNHELR